MSRRVGRFGMTGAVLDLWHEYLEPHPNLTPNIGVANPDLSPQIEMLLFLNSIFYLHGSSL